LAYHDYEGIALNLDERDRLVADLGAKNVMLLRNHGTLAVGRNGAEAFMAMFYLERACKQQVMALSAGEKILIAPSAAQDEVRRQVNGNIGPVGNLAWPALLRKLDREMPGYAN
jgi:ribulose-5-phosphate 4-epimerase/fuculose-1-phosphate aldolase